MRRAVTAPVTAPGWLLGGLAFATACTLLAPLGWPFELFSHFRLQLAAAALVLAVLLAWRRRAVLAASALALAAWHAAPIVLSSAAVQSASGCDGPVFTVVTANLQFSNTRQEPFLAWLDAQQADLVVLQEVTEAWARRLAQLRDLPHQHALARDDPYGMAVLSRRPLESFDWVDLVGDGLPSVEGAVLVHGRRVRFLGLHTHWPLTPGLARARDAALQRAARLAGEAAGPVVLLGDLNVTPDSPVFDRLLADSGLRDVLQGAPWRPTWAARAWPVALRIDHILVPPAVCVEYATVGPAIGSDHRPVLARLRLSSSASGPDTSAGTAR